MDEDRGAVLKELRTIPGVGVSIAEDFWMLGIRSVPDLRGRDPQEMYDRLCGLYGAHIDRCMLYVMRCAVYFAEHERHDPERLKWWNWKDPHPPRRPRARRAGDR